jgi:uncharacterized membrane protein YbhN (UPF0104 family)
VYNLSERGLPCAAIAEPSDPVETRMGEPITAARQPLMRRRWWILSLVVTIGALGAALALVDTRSLGTSISRISIGQFSLIALLLTAGAIIASIRLQFIVSDVGHQISLRDAVAAMSIGNAAGAVLLQLFGQIAARSAYLAPRGLSLSANIVISIYERLIALGISFCLALVGAWLLFGHLDLKIEQGGAQFLNILAGLAVAVLAGGFFGWGRFAIEAVRPLVSRRTGLIIARNGALTLAIHLCTAAAYVLAAKSLVSTIDLGYVAAASLVVMFAASLPISLAGWGVRELSAVLAFNLVGVPTEDALAVSVIVGGVSLLVVVVLAGVTVLTPRRPQLTI